MGLLVRVVGTMANVLMGMVTWEIVLTNMCSGCSVDIWLMCKGNSEGLTLQLNGDLGVEESG